MSVTKKDSGKEGDRNKETNACLDGECTVTAISEALVHDTDHGRILDRITVLFGSLICTAANGSLHRLNGLLLLATERLKILVFGFTFDVIFLDAFRQR